MMKTSPFLYLLALALTLTCLLSGGGAQAAPAPVQAQATGVVSPAGATTDCLRACLDEFQKNVKEGKRICRHCAVSILGLCVSTVIDSECVQSNLQKAEEIHEACKKDCEKS